MLLAFALPLAFVLVFALFWAGCGSSTPACKTDEDKISTGECVPDYDVATPGVEGSGAPVENDPEKPSNGAQPFVPDPPGGTLSAGGAAFIGMFEGFRSCPYWDQYGSVWTRGFGETGGISRSSPCISRAQGEKNLMQLVARDYGPGVDGIGVAYSINQWDSLASFAYNLGAGIFKGNLREQLRKYNPQPMLAYNKAGGQVLPGLKRRREAEVELFKSTVAAPPFDKAALEARQRTLRRELQSKGCRRRKAAGEPLGPKCTRWFAEGDEVGKRLREGK